MIEYSVKLSEKIDQILLLEVEILNRVKVLSENSHNDDEHSIINSILFNNNSEFSSQNELDQKLIEHSPIYSKSIDDLKLAKDEYIHRRSRESFFEELDIFGEPAWDIILDLYISRIEGRKISVSSACIASACPPTTALRWIGILEERGLIHKTRDRDDGRRAYLRLDENFAKRVKRFLLDRADKRLTK